MPTAAREAQERAKTATQQDDQPGPSGTCEALTSKSKAGGKGRAGSLAKASKKNGAAVPGGRGGGKAKPLAKGSSGSRGGGKAAAAAAAVGKKRGRGSARGADPKGKRPVDGDESWDESEEDGESSSSDEGEGEGADPGFDAAAGEVSMGEDSPGGESPTRWTLWWRPGHEPVPCSRGTMHELVSVQHLLGLGLGWAWGP